MGSKTITTWPTRRSEPVRQALTALGACLAPQRLAPVCPIGPGTMRGALYAEHGPASVLSVRDDLPQPLPTEHHVIVRVRAAGVNPVDFKVRHHRVATLAVPLPKIPGTDLAGEVVHAPVGSGFVTGERVFGMMPLLGTRWGASAELAPVAPRFLAHTPANVDDVGAASLPLVALTVLQGIRSAIAAIGDPRGRWALVQAASGGTGSMAVQILSRIHGMRVIGTCSADNTAFVRGLGAERVLDYRTEAFEDVVRDVDLVFDPLGYRYARRTSNSGVLRVGGHYVHLASSDWAQGPSAWGAVPEARPLPMAIGFGRQLWTRFAVPAGLARAHWHHVFVHPDGALLEQLAPPLADGRVTPTVGRVLPLAEIRQAQEHVQAGHTRGKVVLRLD